VPWSKKADELFSELQKNKVHMAIIIDEYGGTPELSLLKTLWRKLWVIYLTNTMKKKKISKNWMRALIYSAAPQVLMF